MTALTSTSGQGAPIATPIEDHKGLASNPALSPEERLAVESVQRKRIPVSSPRQKLTTPEIPGYHLHWFNDDEGRIEAALQGGYDFVKKGEAIITSPTLTGEPLDDGSDLGSRVSLAVGTRKEGGGMRAYLMKIPEQFFREDQDAIQERVDSVHRAMRQGKQKTDGESEADAKQRYVSRHSISQTNVIRKAT